MTRSMTRPIFWPLVLVAIGLVWLLNSFGVISQPSLSVVFQFWPVALIAIGLEVILRPRWPVISNLISLATVTLAVCAVIFARQLGLPTGGTWLSWMPFPWGTVTGTGHVVSEPRAVSNFDAVAFSSFGELAIQPGDQEALSIEAEDNVLPEVLTEVRGNTLYIRYAEHNGQVGVRPTRPIRLTLTVKQLSKVDLSGAGDVHVNGLQADHLQATLSGAGSLDASGAVKRLEAVISGAGSYNGGDLQSELATVTLSGVGNAVVWATQNLNVTLSGVGWVNYFGQPHVTKTVTGLGTVSALGGK